LHVSSFRNLIIRKPNYGEAIDGLQQLSSQLKREKSNHSYAALCCLAIARCEQAIRTSSLSAAAYVETGISLLLLVLFYFYFYFIFIFILLQRLFILEWRVGIKSIQFSWI
jgi:hypothetical protein